MAPKTVREARRNYIQELQQGDGNTFLLRNRSTIASLTLPKPSLDSPQLHMVQAGGYFIGDSYHIKNLGSKVEVVRQDAEESTNVPEQDILDSIVQTVNPSTLERRHGKYRDVYPEKTRAILIERGELPSEEGDGSKYPEGKVVKVKPLGGTSEKKNKNMDSDDITDGIENDGVGI